MKQSIINRIRALGGDTSKMNGESMSADLCSITFSTVLYRKPPDTPWAKVEEQEPIDGLGDFIQENLDLFKKDKERFFDTFYHTFFTLTEEPYGQYFWLGEKFTPFRKESKDFEEFHYLFDPPSPEFAKILSVTNGVETDFVHLFYGFAYPDGIFVASVDKNPENPTVFGTDHEAFFYEIDEEGDLESYLQSFWTKDELREVLEKYMEELSGGSL